jgi:hypothetical protein
VNSATVEIRKYRKLRFCKKQVQKLYFIRLLIDVLDKETTLVFETDDRLSVEKSDS